MFRTSASSELHYKYGTCWHTGIVHIVQQGIQYSRRERQMQYADCNTQILASYDRQCFAKVHCGISMYEYLVTIIEEAILSFIRCRGIKWFTHCWST